MNGNELENNGDWKEWRRLIIYELKRLDKIQEKSQKTIERIQYNRRVNLEAIFYGALGGIIATIFLWSFLG